MPKITRPAPNTLVGYQYALHIRMDIQIPPLHNLDIETVCDCGAVNQYFMKDNRVYTISGPLNGL